MTASNTKWLKLNEELADARHHIMFLTARLGELEGRRIHSEVVYQTLLALVGDKLWLAGPCSREEQDLVWLVKLISDYENIHYPIGEVTGE